MARIENNYQKQKLQFEAGKNRKIENLLQRKTQIEEKIQRLQADLIETEEQISKKQNEEFISLELFLERAQQQREKAKKACF